MAWMTQQGQQYVTTFGQHQNITSQQNVGHADLTLGIPHVGTCSVAWAMNFRLLQLPGRVKFITLSGQPVDQARNMIVEQSEGDWIFFLDSDVICPPDTIPRLMKHNLPIVSGLYWRRDTMPVPGAYKWFKDNITPFGRGGHRAILNFKPGELLDVDAIGAGCMLVKTEVFKKIPKTAVRDWYVKNYGDTPINRDIPPGWFYFGTISANQMSEDFIFNHVAQEYGFRTIVDTSVLAEHILPFRVGAQGFQAVDAG